MKPKGKTMRNAWRKLGASYRKRRRHRASLRHERLAMDYERRMYAWRSECRP